MHKLPRTGTIIKIAKSHRGLFLNQMKSQCSIYEVGLMVYNAIKSNLPEFKLDYAETNASLVGVDLSIDYDFCIVNWHHITLNLPIKTINKLPGFKIAIILEVTPSTPFTYLPNNWFDAYMVIDPTKTKTENIFPFPRPLEIVKNLKPILHTDRIVIGSFGFVVPNGPGMSYKRFDQVVLNANQIGKALVRFNFPSGTYTGYPLATIKDYGKRLQSLAVRGVDVEVTHEYFSKTELIQWCSQNTINVFPYYRDLPGLSAVTDQAISANRPIAVTDNVTFRHLHPYISNTSKQTYLELIKSTPPGIKKMQELWSISRFSATFRDMLEYYGLL